ncbi:hypothetical protein [Streptomyces daliensis]|uniref:Uncharacterized protein n=1 Tax=Streptomyces daliensis TaxID=299421 RepID=A0A8T4IUU4_9ACTN|nr:hypothetical protein [Streptomyces daliensis]
MASGIALGLGTLGTLGQHGALGAKAHAAAGTSASLPWVLAALLVTLAAAAGVAWAARRRTP